MMKINEVIKLAINFGVLLPKFHAKSNGVQVANFAWNNDIILAKH